MSQQLKIGLCKALFLDIDGTWFRWQLFVEWIEEAVLQGILPRVVMSKAEKARRDYDVRAGIWDDFVRLQVAAYQEEMRLAGVRVSDAIFVAQEVIRKKGQRVHVFTRDLVKAAQSSGYICGVISGSPHEVVQAFAEANDIELYQGTVHPRDNGVFTGGAPKEWVLDKGAVIKEWSERHGLDLSLSVAGGDSLSDEAMFRPVGRAICLNPSLELLRAARRNQWAVVNERKAIWTVFVPDRNGRLVETRVHDILPADLADQMARSKHYAAW